MNVIPSFSFANPIYVVPTRSASQAWEIAEGLKTLGKENNREDKAKSSAKISAEGKTRPVAKRTIRRRRHFSDRSHGTGR